MLCIGIESSCDDTSLALVRDGQLLGQKTSSQTSLHALFGGVVPELASREHAKFIGPLFDALLSEHNLDAHEIETVAVARGPGLLGSLLVGIAFAKSLALGLSTRLVGVNHLHAHLMAAGIEQEILFPAIGLLVSGGHTHLYLIESHTQFQLLGKSLDDAAGEAFDKAGKMLGLPYPAGKLINQLAKQGTVDKRLFPRPYLNNTSLDFSFSGLKTAMAVQLVAKPLAPAQWAPDTGELSFESPAAITDLADICASYTHAIVATLQEKTRRALVLHPQTKSLILAGGVAANSHLREAMRCLAEETGKHLTVPSYQLCTDNGAMIAYLGWLLAKQGYFHSFSMGAVPRGQQIPDDMLQQQSKMVL